MSKRDRILMMYYNMTFKNVQKIKIPVIEKDRNKRT